jgi:hypothetical protein
MKRYITVTIMLVLASSMSFADDLSVKPGFLEGPPRYTTTKDSVPVKGFLKNNCPTDSWHCGLINPTELSLYVNKKGFLKVKLTVKFSDGCSSEKFVVIPPQSGGRHYMIGVLSYEPAENPICTQAEVVVHKKITLGRAKPGDSVSVNGKFMGMIK